MAAFCLAFSPDGRRLACGCADGRVSVRDAATGVRVRADVRHAEPVGAVAFSPEGSWVTSVGRSMNPVTRECVGGADRPAEPPRDRPLGILRS